MRSFVVAVLLSGSLAGCATLGLGGDSGRVDDMWGTANDALAAGNFDRAEDLFQQLADNHPDKVEGRESLFYLGVIAIDPRNPEWNPAPAETRFADYLSYLGDGNVRLFRYLEATAFHQLAVQLNLPAESRLPGLQPEPTVVRTEERVVVPARQSRELAAEVQRLRDQVAERDAQIQTQREELDRIRRTLSAPRQ